MCPLAMFHSNLSRPGGCRSSCLATVRRIDRPLVDSPLRRWVSRVNGSLIRHLSDGRVFMEAASTGPGAGGAREADIAPAPTAEAGARAAGWSPADPGPLGLAAFAMTTFVLSMYNADLVNPAGTGVVLPLALIYGGVVQILAGMWEFRTGNTFGAVAFSSYGAFWIAVYFFNIVIFPVRVKAALSSGGVAAVHNADSLFLYGWAIFTTYMFFASLRTSAAVAAVFGVLTVTFFLLAIGNASLAGTADTTNNTIKLGGWFGLVTAALAWYASSAAVINSTFAKTLLPVMPLRR
jgi:succinate-acetate transporter protein